MLSIDIKQSMDRDLEGVVIQYTDDNGQNWNNIGAVDGSFAVLEDIPFADDGNHQSGWIYGDWVKPENMP